MACLQPESETQKNMEKQRWKDEYFIDTNGTLAFSLVFGLQEFLKESGEDMDECYLMILPEFDLNSFLQICVR